MISLSSDTGFAENTRSDAWYLAKILEFLLETRLQKGWSVEQVAKKARLSALTIHRAEQRQTIPNSRQFRKWSGALGMGWEEVWSRN